MKSPHKLTALGIRNQPSKRPRKEREKEGKNNSLRNSSSMAIGRIYGSFVLLAVLFCVMAHHHALAARNMQMNSNVVDATRKGGNDHQGDGVGDSKNYLTYGGVGGYSGVSNTGAFGGVGGGSGVTGPYGGIGSAVGVGGNVPFGGGITGISGAVPFGGVVGGGLGTGGGLGGGVGTGGGLGGGVGTGTGGVGHP